ncbi:MAG: hypothetical protein AMJ78_05545 [Omnitrophica WOR_2 bacterium SM23_29]|nr:MAG: hypothetical protein AMJ78_05545 [Omnitrophica WOR_2 bacterium SM23_29]
MKRKIFIFFCTCVMTFLFFLTYTSAEVRGAFSGHLIIVDGSIGDWIGVPPTKPNSSTVSQGEYIWKDAEGDDTGNGRYTYPTNIAFGRAADLQEFRVTWDSQNVYLLIRCSRPGDWWVPYRLIAIDQDGAKGGKGGSQVLAQGDVNLLGPDGGTVGELRVSPELAAEYVIGISSTFRGRIWDANGKLVARTDGKRTDTEGFLVKDSNWSAIEVAIPQRIIGNPSGKTWRFVVATGLEENGYLREVWRKSDEWHGGGGEDTGAEDGTDPDFYDLASPDRETQETELSSYKSLDPAGDTRSFATIKKSYLPVTFSSIRFACAD